MLRRLLVAADASRAWTALLPMVRGLALQHDAEVVLFEAVPLEAGDGALFSAMRDAHRRLATAAAELADDGLTAHVEVRLGDPVPALARLAATDHVSLVVLASRGRWGRLGWLRHSVTADALRAVPRPLLVANTRRLARPLPVAVQRILVPLADEPSAAPVLPLVVELAAAAGAEGGLTHDAPRLLPADIELFPEAAALLAPTAVDAPWLETVADRLAAGGVRARVRRALSPVLPAIDACVREESADLLVLATHPPVRWIDRLVGSVAERQLRLSPCPIVAVPAPAHRREHVA